MNHRQAIESLYKGKCDIYEYQTIKGNRGVVKTKMVLEYENIPCRLSHSSTNLTEQSDGGVKSQIIKLFLSPDIMIKPNSTIIVRQEGREEEYCNASVSAVYSNHQEIILKIKDKWS